MIHDRRKRRQSVPSETEEARPQDISELANSATTSWRRLWRPSGPEAELLHTPSVVEGGIEVQDSTTLEFLFSNSRYESSEQRSTGSHLELSAQDGRALKDLEECAATEHRRCMARAEPATMAERVGRST